MVTIPAQFNGPLRSGNGGWVCGLLADEWARRHGADPLGCTVTSRLLQPPPLDTTLTWEEDDEAGELRLLTAGGAVIGTASPGRFTADPPPVVSRADADAGAAAYPGYTNHPFDHCFTCGTARDPGDGLRVFSGPIGDDRTAAPWDVHPAFGDDNGLIPTPITWAGLDCPGGWTAGFPQDVILLGQLTAEVMRAPVPGESLLATGQLRSRDDRKRLTSTALYTDDGDLVGRSEQVWIAVG